MTHGDIALGMLPTGIVIFAGAIFIRTGLDRVATAIVLLIVAVENLTPAPEDKEERL